MTTALATTPVNGAFERRFRVASPARFAAAVAAVKHAESKDASGYGYTGIICYRHEQGIRVEATDGHRAARVTLVDIETDGLLPGVKYAIDPRRALVALKTANDVFPAVPCVVIDRWPEFDRVIPQEGKKPEPTQFNPRYVTDAAAGACKLGLDRLTATPNRNTAPWTLKGTADGAEYVAVVMPMAWVQP